MMITGHDVEALRRFPHHCAIGVFRGEDYVPCDKMAVAGFTSEFDGEVNTDAICAYHAHMLGKQGELVPLYQLLGGAE